MVDNITLFKVIDNEISVRLNFSLNNDIQNELGKIQDLKIHKELFVFLYTLICGTDRDTEVINTFLSLYKGENDNFSKHFGSHTRIKFKQGDYKKYSYFFKYYEDNYKLISNNQNIINNNISFVDNYKQIYSILSKIKYEFFKQLAVFDFLQNLYLFGIYNISPNDKEDLQFIIDTLSNKHTSKVKKIYSYVELKDTIISYSKEKYSVNEYKIIKNIIGYIVEGVYCEYGKLI